MRTCKQCIFDSSLKKELFFRRGDYIFFEGDTIKNVFLIEEGIVKLEKLYENGEVRILDLASKGDYLALLTILKNKTQYLVSAICVTDTILRPLDKIEGLRAYQNNPHFMETCLNCASNRIGIFQDHTFLSANTEVEDRIIHTLKHLSNRFGSIEDGKIILYLPISKTELANMIGLRRETLSRKLKSMQEQGKLEIIKNKYIFNSM
jgi:CRP/FNR family transcriptional regulator